MTAVVWYSPPGERARGFWDQGVLEAVFSGTLWPLRRSFEHYYAPEDVPIGEGAIVVVPARWHVEDVDEINGRIAWLPWCLVILTGDEETVFPWRKLAHPYLKVWVQTPRPDRSAGIDHGFGDFWPPDAPRLLAEMQTEKDIPFFFAGQLNNSSRVEADQAMRAEGGGQVVTTKIFGSGLEYSEYLSRLARARIAPCPSGSFTPDTFRLFEALEAGCVPITEAGAPNVGDLGYWSFLLGGPPPWPVVERWSQLPVVLRAINAWWPGAANRCFSWWQAYKRSFALAMDAELTALGEPPWAPHSASEVITVIVLSSPVRAHPSTAHIDETLDSIQARLPGAEIIVCFDGVREEQKELSQRYATYIQTMLRRTNAQHMLPLVFSEYTHQAGMTREALEFVRTPYILFVEHDTPLVGEIDFMALTAAIDSGEANVIRLHHEASVLEPHKHLMLDQEPQDIAGAPLLRCAQWSQRPHLANAAFYRFLLTHYFGLSARTMIEDAMHGIVQTHWNEYGEAGWEHFRLWLYAPPGDIKRSTHRDSRDGEPKYGMHFEYDQPVVPFGAPQPS